MNGMPQYVVSSTLRAADDLGPAAGARRVPRPRAAHQVVGLPFW
jgi:hypothetical protein